MENDQPNHRRTAIPQELRERLLAKYGNACAICGASGTVVPLQFAYLLATSLPGEPTEDNLILLCPTCHMAFDRQPREYEFVAFLSDLLRSHPSYHDVNQEAIIGHEERYRADIIARRRVSRESETVLIECKTAPIRSARLHDLVSSLLKYRTAYGECRLVLSIPATLAEQDLHLLKEANIEVWDLQYIATTFAREIESATPGYYKALCISRLHRSAKPTPEQNLLNALRSAKPGKKDCAVYQSVVGDILELMFCPPLTKPLSEHSDRTRANRRDFILPNYADSGFWRFVREKYCADYIVVDAKNYTNKIKKEEVLQIANYLKPHGAGLFGLIVCRHGGDSRGCDVSLREQWLVHRKLILVLDDEDVTTMLVAKSDGRQPEELIGRRIEEFRLSM